MNGIESITQRIEADARAQADAILFEARDKVQDISRQWEEKARKESADALARGRQAAAERSARLESVAELEGRKLILAAKQEMIARAFDRALEQLLALPPAEKVDLLAALCVKASVSGREEVILSPEDRKEVGAQVVAKANEILAKAVAPKLPEGATQGKLGAILETAATAISAMAKGTAMLTLSNETRPIRGGVILRDAGVEVNCAFDTLVRLARPQLERQVAGILFDE